MNECQSLKDGLEGNKRSKSAEEFLIEQKNPLIIPPDFKSLPEPSNTKNSNIEQNNGEFDIDKIIGKSKSVQTKNFQLKNDSLEKSIIEIIKQN